MLQGRQNHGGKGWIRDPDWIRENYLLIISMDAQISYWQKDFYATDEHPIMFFRAYK